MAKTFDPALVADLIRVLRLRGPLDDELEVPPAIMPVVVMGSVRPLEQVVSTPVHDSTTVFTNDLGTGFINAPNGHIFADTGALVNGSYDVIVRFAAEGTTPANSSVRLEHRNAANTANIHTWAMPVTTPDSLDQYDLRFAYGIGEGERLRLGNFVNALGAGNVSVGSIMAKLIA